VIVTTLAGVTRAYAQRARLLTDAGARELARRGPWWIAPAILLASIPIAFVSPTVAKVSWLLLLAPGLGRAKGSRPNV
jgi:hypothetical protein